MVVVVCKASLVISLKPKSRLIKNVADLEKMGALLRKREAPTLISSPAIRP